MQHAPSGRGCCRGARIVDSWPPCVVIEAVKVGPPPCRRACPPARAVRAWSMNCFSCAATLPNRVGVPKATPSAHVQVLEVRDRLVLDLGAMPAPVLVLGDDQLRDELLDVADAHLGPLASCALVRARARGGARCRSRCSRRPRLGLVWSSQRLDVPGGGGERLGIEPTRRPPSKGMCSEPGHQRSELNAARISVEKSSGSSQAAKWPPLSTSLK